MPCNASLLFSINSLKLPQREYSGGICVRLIQPPLANMKKSSRGFTDESLLFASSGVGFFSTGGCDPAGKANAQKTEITTGRVNLSIAEETREARACPILTQTPLRRERI